VFGGVAVRQAQLRLTEAEPERMIVVRQSGQDKEQPLSVRQALPEADTLGMIRLFQASLLCLKRACHHTVPQSFARMAVSLLTEHCVSLRSSRALSAVVLWTVHHVMLAVGASCCLPSSCRASAEICHRFGRLHAFT